MQGVWDGLDKHRIARAAVTAFYSDDYLGALADINNAQTPDDVRRAREQVKDLMGLWRQECPEYAFMVDCLFLFSEKMEQVLAQEQK